MSDSPLIISVEARFKSCRGVWFGGRRAWAALSVEGRSRTRIQIDALVRAAPIIILIAFSNEAILKVYLGGGSDCFVVHTRRELAVSRYL